MRESSLERRVSGAEAGIVAGRRRWGKHMPWSPLLSDVSLHRRGALSLAATLLTGGCLGGAEQPEPYGEGNEQNWYVALEGEKRLLSIYNGL